MKTQMFKKIATTLAVIATISFSSVIQAEEITLPKITAPSVLQEGVQRELTDAQIAELLPWAKDSKIFLSDMIDNIHSLSTTDKIDRLVEGMQSVVSESAPKNTELLMRYALNRGLVLNEIIGREASADAVGSADAKLRVLVASVNFAIKYYEIDMQNLTKKTKTPFIVFGVDYHEFLTELNKSVFDASAQYAIQRTSLEWLQWDLYRDINNTAYAPQIVKINNALKLFPSKKLSDAQSIAFIRQMKSLSLQLKIRAVSQDTDKTLKNAEVIRLNNIRNEQAKLKVGDRVIWAGRYDNQTAKVAAIQDNGFYTIRYESGVIQSNVERSTLAVTAGCGEKFCIGDSGALIAREPYASVSIAGIQMDNTYVLKYEDGPNKGKLGQGWSATDLAKLKGCIKDGFCVGDKVINTSKNATAIVIGVQVNNKYLLKFTSTSISGLIGANWEKSDIVIDSDK